MATSEVARLTLLAENIPPQMVRRVEIQEITFGPGQKAPLHRHPCPVIGLVLEGEILYQIEGQAAKTLKSGEAFYEPQNMRIAHFDNASDKAPMRFIACYLVDAESQRIELLEC